MERRCPVCGNLMSNTRRKFCSDRCSHYFGRAKYNAKERMVGPDMPTPRDVPKKLKGQSMEQVIEGMVRTGLQYGDYVSKYGIW